ncbi:Aspartokinase [Wickerhamiella sorbophila]|uniref:Aspartokinase n=1 Tax=Wickerhamiella sorbophila TaxID=45607 RepID=A0A2T0FLC1_9ASCO|nr:Aspartokinase [Wickerhamiella sorbophila]PRT55786.1 Aspartokinase [Wickerhamiella sorbophila]
MSNMAMKPWVVQKFGGTSVGKFPRQIAEDIINIYDKDHSVVAVCSARSTNIKAEGTTTRLLEATDQALKLGGNFKKIIETIRADHLNAAKTHIPNDELVEALERDINRECDEAIKILEASRILDEISNRTMDLVLSVGEKLSCMFMAAVITSTGRKAVYVDFSRLRTGPGDINQEFYDVLKDKMADEIHKIGDAIPVVTGFFGLVPGGLISTVGRGYTDLCAALIAVGLRAEELQIWKEVDGIFSADPRKVPTARLLDQITPEEAAELTYYGSEVIHPFTMEQVIQARIPIRIKNVMRPKGQGTRIFPENDSIPGDETPLHPPIPVSPSFVNLQQAAKGPTAVTSKSNILVLNIHSNKTRKSHGFLAHVFGVLDKWKLVVDLISTSEVHVSMAIHAAVPDVPLADALVELRKFGSVDVTRKLCIVSLVGTQMKQLVGIAGKMFTTLAEAGVNLEMISQGASEINISCVVDERDSLKAVNVLHHRLLSQPLSLH